jgi:hypothetical protein
MPMPQQRVTFKPIGLWVSDEDSNGDGWSDWVFAENFHVECMQNATEVTLRPRARIMLIDNEDELDAFSALYGRDMDLGANTPGYFRGFRHHLDWPKVAEKYQGIVITPYLYSRRFSESAAWYYPWDCASGCIWDRDAILSLTRRDDLAWKFKERLEEQNKGNDNDKGSGEQSASVT